MEYTYSKGKLLNSEALSDGYYFYPSTIKYTSNNITGKSPRYEVVFNSSGSVRSDASINAKLGLKQIDPYTLDNIKIYYTTRDTLVRGYKFNYIKGKFEKTLLASVSETDSENEVFYTHTFDYYNDVANGYYTQGEELKICGDKCFNTKISIPTNGYNYFYHYSLDARMERGLPKCSHFLSAKIDHLNLNGSAIYADPDSLYLTHYLNNSWCDMCPSEITNFTSPGDSVIQNPEFNNNFNSWINRSLSSVNPRYASFYNKSGVYIHQSGGVGNVTGLQGEFISDQDFLLDCYFKFPYTVQMNFSRSFNKTKDSILSALPVTLNITTNEGTKSFGPYINFFEPSVTQEFEDDLQEAYEGYPYPDVRVFSTSSVEIEIPSTQLDFINISVISDLGSPEWPFRTCYDGSSQSSESRFKFSPVKTTNLPPKNASFDKNLLARYNISSLSSKSFSEQCDPITNSNGNLGVDTQTYPKSASLLGSTSGYQANVGGYIGIGIGKDFTSKSNTLGFQVNYGWNKTETFTTLEDIDGDGLLDIIIKDGEILIYRKHTINNNTHKFLAAKPLFNIDNIYKQTGKNLSANFQGTCIAGFGGIDGSYNWNETSVYLTDANSDGLIDVAREGIIYFNQRNQYGNIDFNNKSDKTENLIITAASRTDVIPAQELYEEIDYPVCDVIKIWEAPASGTIKIYNDIKLEEPNSKAFITIEKYESKNCFSTQLSIPPEQNPDFNYYINDTAVLTVDQCACNGCDGSAVFPLYDIWYATINGVHYGSPQTSQNFPNMLCPVHLEEDWTKYDGYANLCPEEITTEPNPAIRNLAFESQYTNWFADILNLNPSLINVKNTSYVSLATDTCGWSEMAFEPISLCPIKNYIGYESTFQLPDSIPISVYSVTNYSADITYYGPRMDHSYEVTRVPSLYINVLYDNDPHQFGPYNTSSYEWIDLFESNFESFFVGTDINLLTNNGQLTISIYSLYNEFHSITLRTSTNQNSNNFTSCRAKSEINIPCLLFGREITGPSHIIENIITEQCLGSNIPLSVAKGDTIYFRVHSSEMLSNDIIKWDPRIQYTDALHQNIIEPNELNPYDSKYSDGFILTGKEEIKIKGRGSASLNWQPIDVNDLSDEVIFKISRIDEQFNLETGEIIQTIPTDVLNYTVSAESQNLPLFTATNIPIQVTNGNDWITTFYFSVFSKTNVDWKKIEWNPVVYCETYEDIIGKNGQYEKPVKIEEIKLPIIDYNTYKLHTKAAQYSIYYADLQGIGYKIYPELGNIQFHPKDNGFIYLTAKMQFGYENLGSITITVQNGVITKIDPPYLEHPNLMCGGIEITYTSDDTEKTDGSFSLVDPIVNYNGNIIKVGCTSTGELQYLNKSNVNIFHKVKPKFGPMYRNWGQFMYDASLDPEPIPLPTPLIGNFINRSVLKVSEAEAGEIELAEEELNEINFEDLTAFETKINTLKQNDSALTRRAFIVARPYKSLFDDELFQKWIGTHEESYASALCSRSATFSQSYNGFINEQINLAQLGDITTGAYSIPKNSEGKSTNLSAGIGIISASKSINGFNWSYSDYFDLNGDGYPDIITKEILQKTNKCGGLNSGVEVELGMTSGSKSESSGLSACNSFAISGEEQTTSNTKSNASAGISGSLSSGSDRISVQWFDINGDGLPDKYNNDGTNSQIQLNLGKDFKLLTWPSFESSVNESSTLSAGIGLNLKKGSIEAGLSVSNCFSTSKTTMQDINADGLIDLLKVNDQGITQILVNTGSTFLLSDIKFEDFNLVENSESVSNSLNAGFSLSLIWPVVFVPVKLPCVNINGQYGETNNRTKKMFKDFDGDGFDDFLEEIDPNNIRIYYSKIGRTNKLKTVTNPLNGSFTIDYKANSKTYGNPNSLWVMSEVIVKDGLQEQNIVQHGKSTYTKHFEYEGAKYDRRERDFLGFKKVISHDIDENDKIYRSQSTEYLNDSYYTKGLVKESLVYKGSDDKMLYSKVTNEYVIKALLTESLGSSGVTIDNMLVDEGSDLGLLYDVGGQNGRSTAIVLLKNTISCYYNESTTAGMASKIEFEYNNKGMVKKYSYLGDVDKNTDDYYSTITYLSREDLLLKNIVNIPDRITVMAYDIASSGFKLVRDRKASDINEKGLVKTITTDVTGSLFGNGTPVLAITHMDYNEYGNLISIEFPENDNVPLQKVKYEYTYDPENQKSIIGVKYANLLYSSSTLYNHKFDVIRQVTDISGSTSKYYYDNKGRLIRVVGPNEVNTGRDEYTIKFDYFLPKEDLVAYAVTKHYDSQHQVPTPNDIETYNFVDGLGRIIQVKKDIDVNTNMNPYVKENYVEGMSVSGWINYDSYGRKIEEYLPTWEPKDLKVNMLLNLDLIRDKSAYSYDELDRVLVQTDPETHSLINEYSLEENKLKTVTIIENTDNKIVKETYKDVAGKTIKSISLSNDGDQSNSLVTTFEYNPLGELVKTIDPSLLESKYYYDNRGLKVGYFHPDMGLTRYTYDKAGNITSQDSPQFDKITYKYAYDQLTEINFPDVSGLKNISNVRYYYGAHTEGTQAGRIIRQTDATGSQEFKYGKMGEVIFNNRTVQYGTFSSSYETYFEYDSWNRVKQITYPGGEVISYNYNRGGQLDTMKNNNSTPYFYISRSDYNYFGELTYQKYGNNTETVYSYTDKLRRLNSLTVTNSSSQKLMNPVYTYDFIGNITGITNSNAQSTFVLSNVGYDEFNRLTGAVGNYTSTSIPAVRSSYNLSLLKYHKSGEIWFKNQQHTTNPNNSYNNVYDYFSGSHKLLKVKDAISGKSEEYTYDLNGNMTKRLSSIQFDYSWDEVNRLRSIKKKDINNQLTTHLYYYDDKGERIIKIKGTVERLYQNADLASSQLLLREYTLYPSAFITQSDKNITKHYYAGTKKIASRIIATQSPSRSLFDNELNSKQIEDLNMQTLNMGCSKFKFEFEEIEEDLSDSIREAVDGLIYFYHPDHLGTNTAISNSYGNLHQYFFNLPFGETMIESNNTNFLNYKFNGKELDVESGLYYYGARYYDPRLSVWLSVDPIAQKYPNLTPYNFTNNSPFVFVDPNGMDIDPKTSGNVKHYVDPESKQYNKAFAEKYQELKNDHNAVYSFNKKDKSWLIDNRKVAGDVTYNGKNEEGQYMIGINYTENPGTIPVSKQSPLLEETFHAYQFSKGDFGFIPGKGTFALDLYDEAEAKAFAAQNSKTPLYKLDLEILNNLNNNELDGVVKHLSSKAPYDKLLQERSNVIQAIDPGEHFLPNGQSIHPNLIMQRPK